MSMPPLYRGGVSQDESAYGFVCLNDWAYREGLYLAGLPKYIPYGRSASAGYDSTHGNTENFYGHACRVFQLLL